MKNIIFLLISQIAFAQGNFYTFDMTELLSPMQMEGGISVGNAIYEPYFEVVVYPENGVMDFQGKTLEIMNSKITIYGDTINSNIVIKRFLFVSELVIESPTLSVEQPVKIEMKMYPNPASNFTAFKGDYIEKLVVYDMNGKTVKRADVKDTSYQMNIESFASGTYVVQIWMAGNRGVYKKLIVK